MNFHFDLMRVNSKVTCGVNSNGTCEDALEIAACIFFFFPPYSNWFFHVTAEETKATCCMLCVVVIPGDFTCRRI